MSSFHNPERPSIKEIAQSLIKTTNKDDLFNHCIFPLAVAAHEQINIFENEEYFDDVQLCSEVALVMHYDKRQFQSDLLRDALAGIIDYDYPKTITSLEDLICSLL